MEDPVVLGRVLLKDGTWRRGRVKTRPKEKLFFPTLPLPPLWSWCCQDLWLPSGRSSRLAFQDSLSLSSVNQYRNMAHTSSAHVHAVDMSYICTSHMLPPGHTCVSQPTQPMHLMTPPCPKLWTELSWSSLRQHPNAPTWFHKSHPKSQKVLPQGSVPCPNPKR